MAIHVRNDGGFLVEGPQAIAFYRMASLKHALKLEIAGIRVRRGFSAYATIKREFGLKGSREAVLHRFSAMVDEASAFIPRIHEEESK